MTVVIKLPSGRWRVQFRHKGSYASNTFKPRADADSCVLNAERNIDLGIAPKSVFPTKFETLGDMIDIHLQDRAEASNLLGAQKAAMEEAIGSCRSHDPMLLTNTFCDKSQSSFRTAPQDGSTAFGRPL